MPLLALFDHLRRTSRCWVAIALMLGGAFLVPLQVSAAGAAPAKASPTAVSSVRAPEPDPGPWIVQPGVPPKPECPPWVATCDDVTIDPCIRTFCPPPPCEEGDDECP